MLRPSLRQNYWKNKLFDFSSVIARVVLLILCGIIAGPTLDNYFGLNSYFFTWIVPGIAGLIALQYYRDMTNQDDDV